MRGQFQSIYQQLRNIHNQMDRVHRSGMSAQDKRERLDDLYARRNRTVARIEGMLRDVVVEDGEIKRSPYAENSSTSWMSLFREALAAKEPDRMRAAAHEAATQGYAVDPAEAARQTGNAALARIVENAGDRTLARIEEDQQ
jgi:hypothetical protein